MYRNSMDSTGMWDHADIVELLLCQRGVDGNLHSIRGEPPIFSTLRGHGFSELQRDMFNLFLQNRRVRLTPCEKNCHDLPFLVESKEGGKDHSF